MKVDYSLILSAGLGTRMGPIGKILPKPLWPIFHKRLLELQVAYARKLHIEQNYMNVHFGKEVIEDFLKDRPLPLKMIWEEELLDIGGAIHNLAHFPEVNYQGILLILNCDQFLFFNPSFFQQALQDIQHHPVVLFACQVDPQSGYNQLILDGDKNLSEIKKFDPAATHHQRNQPYLTYTGVCLVNLSLLKPREGKSPFFQSVANFKQEKIKVIPLPQPEYWDFGTSLRYKDSMFSLLQELCDYREKMNESFLAQHSFLSFCLQENIFNHHLLHSKLQSYGVSSMLNPIPSPFKKVINLSVKEVTASSFLPKKTTEAESESGDVIILQDWDEKINPLAQPGIYFRNEFNSL